RKHSPIAGPMASRSTPRRWSSSARSTMSSKSHLTSSVPTVRFGASWSTQFRFTQAIGRGLSELKRVRANVLVGDRWGVKDLDSGELDIVYSKSVVNQHRYSGRGYYAGSESAPWLRTIAWLP